MKLHEAPELYEKVISENEEDLHQVKFYLDFDGDFKPSKDGIAMKLDFNNSKGLFEGLVEILSLAESKSILETHFKDILDEIYLS